MTAAELNLNQRHSRAIYTSTLLYVYNLWIARDVDVNHITYDQCFQKHIMY